MHLLILSDGFQGIVLYVKIFRKIIYFFFFSEATKMKLLW